MVDLCKQLLERFKCRSKEIRKLFNLYGYNDEPFPDCVYVYGCTSTGKTSIVTALLQIANVNFIFVNLIECYTAKILYEKILNSYSAIVEDAEPIMKCDNMMSFINQLKHIFVEQQLKQCVFVFEKAERFRDMDINLLPSFLRFRELSNLSISSILISEIEFTKLIPKFDVSPPIEIYFSQYTKSEINQILTCEFLNCKLAKTHHLKLANEENFYYNYLNAFLSVFHSVCCDLSELRYLAKKTFPKFVEPVISKEVNEEDIGKLWRNIVPELKSSLNQVYLRINTIDADSSNKNECISLDTSKKQAQNLELPFYAKYLLIAAYLASYNPAKEDKRLFMKYHGKKTKTKKQMNAKNKVTEQLNTQLGPKAFSFDRLLAIFFAILEDKIGLNSNLLVQVTSLVQLQLLSAIGDNTTLENQKYICNVGYEFIQTVSKMVGFNIRKYLYDFI